MRRHLAGILASLALLLLPATVRAQRPGDLRYGITRSASESVALLPVRVPKTHWKRGALVGGILGTATWVGYLAIRGCGSTTTDETCASAAVWLAPVAALLGAIPGALIGGLFPKD